MNTNLVYLLLWTSKDFSPFPLFSSQEKFTKYNCLFSNCYVTDDRKYFGVDFGLFDAVAFNGRNLDQVSFNLLHRFRTKRQKFIYIMSESAQYYPVLNKRFDGFFNWTMTYRLDSDIPDPYIIIRNSYGNVVGPKEDMHWETDVKDVDEKLSKLLGGKFKAAAWFASNCESRSKREDYVKHLNASLQLYGYGVDVFGKCGPANRRQNYTECEEVLEKDYYFYLSFENSFAKDYVTEKILTPLHHNAVPIVFGGANYSRFLPPGSYLNARDYTPEEMAYIMRQIMLNPAQYRQYFRWRSRYAFEYANNACKICDALNNRTMFRAVTQSQ